MRICLVHEEYPEETNFGGIATYQKACAEEYVRQGNSVIVICRGLSQNKEYIENGVKIFRIFQPSTGDQVQDYINYRQKVASMLIELQNKNEIDVIEVPDWGAETIYFEQYRKVPLVVRLHTPLKVWLKYNKNNFGEVTDKLLTWENEMLKSADLITCCSQVLKNIVIKQFSINSSKIIVTPNPANLNNFYFDNETKKQDIILYVGSLEERKGVCVLAKAINIVLKDYPHYKIRFIGKDTARNKKNISTIAYIKQIVKSKYHPNLEFLGQIENKKLNSYMNEARCCVYPSLFDNFPYVVLETMATGTPIVASKNSGMVEMLNDNSCIYKTGNYRNLAKTIIKTLKHKYFVQNNIDRVKSIYNSQAVCANMINIYKKIIKEHTCLNSKDEKHKILSLILNKKINIYKIFQRKDGVANEVYDVKTNVGHFILKKYLYNYNFKLSDDLSKIYSKAGINVINPISSNFSQEGGNEYKIFPFVDGKHANMINNDFFIKILKCPRKTNMKNTVMEKCEKWQTELMRFCENQDMTIKSDCLFVCGVFEKLKHNLLFEQTFLNHGDISKSNVIKSNKDYYLIDFDETCVACEMYDFAVISIKFFTKGKFFRGFKFGKWMKKVMSEFDYSQKDLFSIIEFYLCKILLEKFYLYMTGKINIYSKIQKKDYYKRYVFLLKNIMNKENRGIK